MKLKPHLIKLDSSNRLHGLPVPIIGLTGGIATGKSTVAQMIRARGLPIIDADQLVKNIYALPETLEHIKKSYPEVVHQGAIQFAKLREKFFQEEKVRQDVEHFIYQRLPQAFQKQYSSLGKPEAIIYDVPLLFEKNLADQVDVKLVVYAPAKVQLARLMKRDGQLEPMASKILYHQMDIEEKKLLADFLIDNSQTEAELKLAVDHFIQQIIT